MLLQNYLIMSFFLSMCSAIDSPWVHLDDLKPYTAGNLFSFFLFYQNIFFFTTKIYARKSGFTYTIRRYSTLTEIVFLFLSFFLSCFNQDTFCYFKTNSRKKCFKPRQKPQSKLSPQNSTSGHATIKRLPKRKAEALTMSLYSFLRRGIV